MIPEPYCHDNPELLRLETERNFVIRTDPHCHILPGLDDGSPDLHVSLSMARRAAAVGIKRMVATPHANHWSGRFKYNSEAVRSAVKKLNRALSAESIPIEVFPGMELYLSEQLPDLFERGEVLSWADQNRYVLLEIGFHDCPDCLWEVLEFFQGKNIVPLIAHPERYNWWSDEQDTFLALEQSGCWFQINVMSINGYWGSIVKERALQFMNATSRWLVGTDSHSDHDKFWDIPRVVQTLQREGLLDKPAAEA